MKLKNKIFAALALAVATTAVLVACLARPNLRHLSADEFIEKAEEIEPANTVKWTSYLGATHSRVYLEFGALSPTSVWDPTTVYWTELDSLPPVLAQQLRSRQMLWPSPYEAGDPLTANAVVGVVLGSTADGHAEVDVASFSYATPPSTPEANEVLLQELEERVRQVPGVKGLSSSCLADRISLQVRVESGPDLQPSLDQLLEIDARFQSDHPELRGGPR